MSELDNIIEDLGFQHSDRYGYMSGIQWKQFAIDLLSASPSIKQGPVAEQFESWWDSPDAPNGQQYEKDIAKQAWVASALYRYTPNKSSPAESDKEAARNAALEEAIAALELSASQIEIIGVRTAALHAGMLDSIDALRKLKSQPAQNMKLWRESIEVLILNYGIACIDKEGQETWEKIKSHLDIVAARNETNDKQSHPFETATTPCNMGVGCESAGVCYAEANGDPSQCGRNSAQPSDTEMLDWLIDNMMIHPSVNESGRESITAAMKAQDQP